MWNARERDLAVKQLEVAFQHRAISQRAIRGYTERHRVKTEPSALCRSVHPLAASVTQTSFQNLKLPEREESGNRTKELSVSRVPEFHIKKFWITDSTFRLLHELTLATSLAG
jgi:hypothetical protein